MLRCRRLVGTIAAAGALLLLLRSHRWQLSTHARRHDERLHGGVGAASASFQRTHDYCEPPVDSGEEGQPQRSGLVLKGVVLAVRHGDRSAIHAVPGASTDAVQAFECAPPDGATAKLWARLEKQFTVVSSQDGRPLRRRIRPQLLKRAEGKPPHRPTLQRVQQPCAPGQLTPKGFAQHTALGRHLARAYAPLLSQLNPRGGGGGGGGGGSPLYVRSTDYTRTIGSVAALLAALLPQQWWERGVGGAETAGGVRIEVNEDERHEIMHGISQHTSSNGTHRAGGTGSSHADRGGPCPRASELARSQAAAWRRPAAIYDELAAVLCPSNGAFCSEATRAAVAAEPITHYADAYYAAACHGNPPPCAAGAAAAAAAAPAPAPQGASPGRREAIGGCVGAELGRQLVRCADAFYCARFAGRGDGGLSSSRLAMQPFLAEIAQRLLQAARAPSGAGGARGAGGSTQRRRRQADGGGLPPVLLSVYSGHDTVIAPVLAALGVYQGARCRWPPYASRVAFELWGWPGSAGQQQQQHGSSTGHTGGGAAAAAATSSFVRVLFNGRPLTGVVGCPPGSQLCPLADFVAGVQGLLGSHRNIADACGLH
jgi:hypothetical protein